jgi:hypothetical protein
MNLRLNILYNKARIYKLKNNIDFACDFAEKAWFHYHNRDLELYNLLVEIYTELEEWEILEDF